MRPPSPNSLLELCARETAFNRRPSQFSDDLSAGLFAPVEILVTEAEDGQGTTITYVRPSSLMVIGNNPPLTQDSR